MSWEHDLAKALTDRSEDGHYRDGCYLIGHVLSPHLDGSGPLIISILDGQAMLTEEMVDRICAGRHLREGMTVAVIPGKRALRGGQRYLVQEIPGHGDLLGRDAEDSHPIIAITGLRGELDNHNSRLVNIETVRLPDLENRRVPALEHDMNDSDGKVPLLTVRVGNLETGKADKGHTHTYADISGLSGLAEQVAGIAARGGEANVIETVKRNGTALAPDASKAVDIGVPEKVSDLTNDSGFQTAGQVQTALDAGLASLLTATVYGPSAMVSFTADPGGLPVRSCRVAGAAAPVTVYRTGKNLVGFPQPQYSTRNGVTMSVTDGELTLRGTATGSVSPFPTSHSNTYADMPLGPFPPGTYIITCTGLVGQNSNDRVVFTARTADNTAVTGANGSRISASGIPDGSGSEKTFTSTQPFKLGFYANIASGTTVDCTVKVQMARAPSLPDYAKYRYDTWTYDPATESLIPPVMTALAGENKIWSDGGDVTVEYGAFLAALQAEIEAIAGGG